MCMCFLYELLVKLPSAQKAMAVKDVRLQAKDFASVFLDLSKNSRGYDGKLLEIDKNMVKRLLCPFPVPSAFRHGLGMRSRTSRTCMHSFVEGRLGNDHQGRGQVVEKEKKPDDTIISKCPKVEKSGSALGGNSTDLSFSYDDRKTRNIEELGNECATDLDQIPLEDEVILDSKSFVSAISSSSSTTIHAERKYELENVDWAIDTYHGADTAKPQRKPSIQPEQTLPLSLFKNLATKQDPPMDLSDLTVKIELQAITSVLENKYKLSTDELNVSGVVALLYGSYAGDSTVSVYSSDIRGVYNYVDGTVKPNLHSENEGFDLVDLTWFLSSQISKAHCKTAGLPGCEISGLPKDSAVAWCISSPGFGIDLDWQVQEKLTKVITDYCDDKTENLASAWCTLLVVVDEYRCAERGLPLVEVYQLQSSSVVKLVNFDFQ